MTWSLLIPSIIGVLSVVVLVLRAFERALPRILTAFASFVERLSAIFQTHGDLVAGLNKRLDKCEAAHLAQDAVIQEQRAEMARMREDLATKSKTIADLLEALGVEKKRTESLRDEREQLADSISAAEHGTTTHRGDPR